MNFDKATRTSLFLRSRRVFPRAWRMRLLNIRARRMDYSGTTLEQRYTMSIRGVLR